jgi:hypothetical protein
MGNASLRWKVVVIGEDDSDGRAIAELAGRNNLAAVFDWLPANGIGNIKRNGERLISLAKDRLQGRRGCVAVIIDRDNKNPSREEPHRTIFRFCSRLRVEFIAARESLEAWFLADPGICRWLRLETLARTDNLQDPKRRVAQAFLRKTGRSYRKRRARMEVAKQSTGIDLNRNRSAQEAVGAVQRCLSLPRHTS